MSKVYITSDLHLGHKNIHKWRPFESPEEHDGVVWDNLCSAVNKRDTIIFLGDVAFTPEWLDKIKELNVKNKVLILGNHDSERAELREKLWSSYDQIHSMLKYKETLLSHCPIHESEFRKQVLNVTGHIHERLITTTESWKERNDSGYWVVKHREVPDKKYFNVCLEHTEYKPLDFQKIKEYIEEVGL